MFELKRLSREGLEAAHDRALHYRLLNQPRLAESICRDVLAVDEHHRLARATLILALCDQFGREGAPPVQSVMALVAELEDAYDRAYYAGLVCERRAQAFLDQSGPASGTMAHEWFMDAMEHYEEAERLRPPANDDPILRWNTCARIVNARSDVRPPAHDPGPHMLE